MVVLRAPTLRLTPFRPTGFGPKLFFQFISSNPIRFKIERKGLDEKQWTKTRWTKRCWTKSRSTVVLTVFL